jgi:hypothetical protein
MLCTRLLLISLLITCFGCDGNEAIQDQLLPELRIENAREKIWAHRVNTLHDLGERTSDFTGIEVDIFFNDSLGKFEVKHEQDSLGIDLEVFLDSVLQIKQLKFWFDYKNLDVSPKKGSALLTEILSKRSIDKSSFVESYFARELELLYGSVATSFWISSVTIPKSQDGKDRLFEEKFEYITDLDVNMLSANYDMFDFLTEYFPSHICNYWMSGDLNEQQKVLLKNMANTTKVNVILIDGNENFVE